MELKEYEIGSDTKIGHVYGVFDEKYGFEYSTSIFSFNDSRKWEKENNKKIVTPFLQHY